MLLNGTHTTPRTCILLHGITMVPEGNEVVVKNQEQMEHSYFDGLPPWGKNGYLQYGMSCSNRSPDMPLNRHTTRLDAYNQTGNQLSAISAT